MKRLRTISELWVTGMDSEWICDQDYRRLPPMSGSLFYRIGNSSGFPYTIKNAPLWMVGDSHNPLFRCRAEDMLCESLSLYSDKYLSLNDLHISKYGVK